MTTKTQPYYPHFGLAVVGAACIMMTEEQLIERDAKRNLGAELLQSVQEMKSGQKGATQQVQVSQVVEARQKVGFSQRQFAELMVLASLGS